MLSVVSLAVRLAAYSLGGLFILALVAAGVLIIRESLQYGPPTRNDSP